MRALLLILYTIKINIFQFEASYAYGKTQSIIIPFLTSFMCTITPTLSDEDHNEYVGFLLRILANRTSESHHIKAAAKMLAAIVNKNDGNEKDGKIWNGILDFYKSRGQKEENVILTVWITKVGVNFLRIIKRYKFQVYHKLSSPKLIIL